MKPLALCLSLLVSSSLAIGQSKSRAGDAIFGLTKVHKIQLSLSADEWAALRTSVGRGDRSAGGSDYTDANGRLIHVGSGFGGTFPWARATVRIGDLAIEDAGLRYKGNSTFGRSSSVQPLLAHFKLKIDVYGAKGSWDGQKTFNLHPGVLDSSRMKDAIAFSIFRGAGVQAPRTAYAEVFFNVPGVYDNTSAGMFTLIEDVNRRFLEGALPPGEGLLMKPEGLRGGIRQLGETWAAYTPIIRPDRDATPREQARVMEFAQLISQPDVERFRAHIHSYLDVDQFLRFIAVNAFIVNRDSYIGGGHNYYLYLDPKDDKFRFIPWDVDLSMSGQGMGQAGNEQRVFVRLDGQIVNGVAGAEPARTPQMVIAGGGIDMLTPYAGDHRLIRLLLEDAGVMSRYRSIIQELSASVFSTPELKKLLDQLEELRVSRGGSPRAFLEARAAYVEQLVSGWK